jgi:hydroxypyruvate isomerase
MPGRNEPGTGGIDWAQKIGLLRRLGYVGDIGLECRPTLPGAESVALSRAALGI